MHQSKLKHFKFHNEDLSLTSNKIKIINTHPTTQLQPNSTIIIENVIDSIFKNGPAGLLHAKILSRALRIPIRISQNGTVVRVFGKHSGRPPIDLEYHRGHWTLRGGRNPPAMSSNDCLYAAVAAQTGHEVPELRRRTATEMRRGRRWLTRMILGSAEPDKVASAMLGGARYTGSGPRDAKRLLDNSQHGQCHPEGRSGHPRGHASYPSGGGGDDSVEAYSYSR